MELKIKDLARGTRIIYGEEAKQRRELKNKMILLAEDKGFDPIELPSVEKAAIYEDKAGKEILNQMYTFPDKKGRELCLRPEGTATVQLLADEVWKGRKDVKVFYELKCWRYERPQKGRYREFIQFGVEWLNPRDMEKAKLELIELATNMVGLVTSNYQVTDSVERGLAYYVENGFEISCPELGAQKQVVGGGAYKQGIGFAVGFDRLALL
jgi:histidyl-tRNA synthetase